MTDKINKQIKKLSNIKERLETDLELDMDILDIAKDWAKEIDNAIGIIKTLSESIKSNNGWILCSERLPDKVELNNNGDGVKPVMVTYLSYYGKKPVCKSLAIYCEDEKWRWFDDTLDVEEMDVAVVDITAWQPLPEPWKGEE